MPVPTPRLVFKQPKALCRTYVYRWAGCLLGTSVNETAIMAGLNMTKSGSALDPYKQDHADPIKTKAYGNRKGPGGEKLVHGPRMGMSGVTQITDDYSVAGYAIVTHQKFSTKNDANQQVRETLREAFNRTPRQDVFALSIHYVYPQRNNEDGAHCVGFFYSNGGFGVRKPGGRFFDPNCGSWQFGSGSKLLDFYCDEWLPSYLAGSISADPNHPTGKTRDLKFFRLVGFMKA